MTSALDNKPENPNSNPNSNANANANNSNSNSNANANTNSDLDYDSDSDDDWANATPILLPDGVGNSVPRLIQFLRSRNLIPNQTQS